jgi:hypothetical protein
MSNILKRDQLLNLNIDLYNQAMEMQWANDKITKNLSGDLSNCKYCNRKYVVCCICDEAEDKFKDMLNEIRNISQRDRSNEF